MKHKFVTRVRFDARPTATFPAAERGPRVTGTKLYSLMTEARVNVRVNNLPKPVPD